MHIFLYPPSLFPLSPLSAPPICLSLSLILSLHLYLLICLSSSKCVLTCPCTITKRVCLFMLHKGITLFLLYYFSVKSPRCDLPQTALHYPTLVIFSHSAALGHTFPSQDPPPSLYVALSLCQSVVGSDGGSHSACFILFPGGGCPVVMTAGCPLSPREPRWTHHTHKPFWNDPIMLLSCTKTQLLVFRYGAGLLFLMRSFHIHPGLVLLINGRPAQSHILPQDNQDSLPSHPS